MLAIVDPIFNAYPDITECTDLKLRDTCAYAPFFMIFYWTGRGFDIHIFSSKSKTAQREFILSI